MKKYLSAALILGLFIANVSSATGDNEKRQIKPPDEQTSVIISFLAATVISGSAHYVGRFAGCDEATRNFLHVANLFYHLGGIANSEVIRGFALETLKAGAAATLVTSELGKAAVAMVPFVGANLAASGPKGVGAMTVATYALVSYLYNTGSDLVYNTWATRT